MWHMCKYVLYIIIPLHEKKTVTTEANPTNRNSNECNLHAKWEIPRTHTSEKWHTFHHFVSVSAAVVSVARLCICNSVGCVWLIMRIPFPTILPVHELWACIHHSAVGESLVWPIWDLCHSKEDEICPTIDGPLTCHICMPHAPNGNPFPSLDQKKKTYGQVFAKLAPKHKVGGKRATIARCMQIAMTVELRPGAVSAFYC